MSAAEANLGGPDALSAQTTARTSSAKALDDWAYRRGVKMQFITAGRPVENAYIEGFNGKLRDE
jgi:putative transposase